MAISSSTSCFSASNDSRRSFCSEQDQRNAYTDLEIKTHLGFIVTSQLGEGGLRLLNGDFDALALLGEKVPLVGDEVDGGLLVGNLLGPGLKVLLQRVNLGREGLRLACERGLRGEGQRGGTWPKGSERQTNP